MRKTQADMQKLYFTFLGLSWIIKCVRDWSHADRRPLDWAKRGKRLERQRNVGKPDGASFLGFAQQNAHHLGSKRKLVKWA